MTWLMPEWPAPMSVRALSTLRVGGVSTGPHASLNLGAEVGDAEAAVAENRRRLRIAARLPAEPSWLAQIHGPTVINLDAFRQDIAGAGHMTADGAVTRRTGRICAILTADCLPVLFAADSGDVVAAAHAGWRGLCAGVLEATVQSMGIAPHRVLAWLGPAIGPQNFEVGAEVRDAFLREDRDAVVAFEINPAGRFQADLYMLARRRLGRAGVARVYGGGECTYADTGRYFSFRRDRQTGRQATLIWLDPARSC